MSQLLEIVRLSDEEKAQRGLSHTPAEILQQPQTWGQTFRQFEQDRPALEQFLCQVGLGNESRPAERPAVFLIGAGTSDYIGQSAASLLRQKWGCHVSARPSTDLLTNVEDYLLPGRKYLWISFSRSGDSPEGVAVLERALERYPQVSHLVISCNMAGRMVRETRDDRVFRVVLQDAVNDRGLAMTSSYTNMVVFAQCLAHLWSPQEYRQTLQRLMEGAQSILDSAADCAARMAEQSYGSVCFTGSGALKAVARESALKVSELTAGKIRTMSESALGLRHGPMAALTHDTLLVSFLSGDPLRRRYELDLLEEIGRKDVVETRVIVANQDDPGLARAAECTVFSGIPDTLSDLYRPPVDVIFGQMLGLFFSLQCGFKPDAPSPQGVIHRVVQGVQIY